MLKVIHLPLNDSEIFSYLLRRKDGKDYSKKLIFKIL